jgi:hypothetical protein
MLKKPSILCTIEICQLSGPQIIPVPHTPFFILFLKQNILFKSTYDVKADGEDAGLPEGLPAGGRGQRTARGSPHAR